MQCTLCPIQRVLTPIGTIPTLFLAIPVVHFMVRGLTSGAFKG
ncbi:hypothetical protein BH24CHL4_BH24CHL4_20470 [soil metagenome]